MLYAKEQDKSLEKAPSDMEISNLSKKEFRIMIIKMIKVLRRRMGVQCEKLEDFNRVREYKEQSNRDEE